MSDYAAHADLETFIAGRPAFTASTKPTDTQVDTFCSEITAELNGVLKAAGYVTPVVSTDALKTLKLWCCCGVAYYVERARYPERKGTDEDLAQDYWDRYQNALKMIRANELDAPSSTDSSVVGTASYWANNPDDTDAVEPILTWADEF